MFAVPRISAYLHGEASSPFGRRVVSEPILVPGPLKMHCRCQRPHLWHLAWCMCWLYGFVALNLYSIEIDHEDWKPSKSAADGHKLWRRNTSRDPFRVLRIARFLRLTIHGTTNRDLPSLAAVISTLSSYSAGARCIRCLDLAALGLEGAPKRVLAAAGLQMVVGSSSASVSSPGQQPGKKKKKKHKHHHRNSPAILFSIWCMQDPLYSISLLPLQLCLSFPPFVLLFFPLYCQSLITRNTCLNAHCCILR